MIYLFINCNMFPFISWILSGLKVYETRNRNTLKSIIGKTVYLTQTGKGKRPIIYGYCTITEFIIINDKKTYNKYRKQTCIKKGSCYDFIIGSTKQKVLYRLENVQACKPFPMPENVIRHGRIYATDN